MRNIDNLSSKEKMGRMGSLNRLLGMCLIEYITSQDFDKSLERSFITTNFRQFRPSSLVSTTSLESC